MSRTLRDGVTAIADDHCEFRARLLSLEWADEWPRASYETAAEPRANGARVPARLYEAGFGSYGWPLRREASAATRFISLSATMD